MSNFLADLARRGAGLAPHTPLRPSLTPFVSPGAAVAGSIERGAERHLNGGGQAPLTPEPGTMTSAAGDIEHAAEESPEISTGSEPMVQRRIAEPSSAQPSPAPAITVSPPVSVPAESALSQVPPAVAAPTPSRPTPSKVAPRLDEPGLVQPELTDTPGPTTPAGSVEPKRAAQTQRSEFSRAPVLPPMADLAPVERSMEWTLEAESGTEALPPQQVAVEAGPVLPTQAPPSPALAAEESPRDKSRQPISLAPPPVAPREVPEPPARPAGFPVEMSASPPSSRAPDLLPSTQATTRAEERAVQIEPALPPPVSLELIAAKQPPPTPVEPAAPAAPAEPQPVQIRIGTVEVRATTPPPAPTPRPSPAPQGFDDYVQIRTYVNREL